MKNLLHNKYKPVQVIYANSITTIQLVTYQQNSFILKSIPIKHSFRLENQVKVYKTLPTPQLNGCGSIIETFVEEGRKYIVLPKLGSNLQELKNRCGGRFSLKTVLMLSFQILERIRYLHNNNYLHGDIKPDNFLVGTGKLKHKIFLIDMELSHQYIIHGKHIKETKKGQIDGTLRFISVNANKGYNISRRDQLQSFIYCLLYFMTGDLPWTKLHSDSFLEACENIRKLKEVKQEVLCQGCPVIFAEILKYIKSLKFEQTPDYDLISGKLLGLFKKNGYQLDYYFDWQYL